MVTLIYDSNSELLYLEISDREKGKIVNLEKTKVNMKKIYKEVKKSLKA